MSIRWAEWGDEVFTRARAEDKPVLLSLTARWCHACHRMDEETWEHPAVTAAVARAVIPMRVDADARPDVYGCYHVGGLPTTALLTSEGDFVRGGTFLSPPQLFAFLESALADWRAGRLPAHRSRTLRPGTDDLVQAFVARLRQRVDPEHGGFGSAPKQPETHALLLLLRSWRASGDAAIARIVRAALDAIVEHLGDRRDGGFFRYAAAADWSGPHTEKVAVDQAQLARLLLEAGATLREPRYAASAREALAHARRRLADDEGRVFASVAADPDYYAGARAPDEPPVVDRRRFADAAAAMASAAWLAVMLAEETSTLASLAGRSGSAPSGDVAGLQAEFRVMAPEGCVPHRLDERGGVGGLLRDQALAIDATLMEHRARGAAPLLEWAERAAAWTVRELWDENRGAFTATAKRPGEGVRLPAMCPLVANGEMALALVDLAALTGREEYRHRADRVIRSLGPEALATPAGAAVALAAQRLADADVDGASPRAAS